MEHMGVVDGMDRMRLIKASIELLSRTNALIYIDIGNPKWLSTNKAVSYLELCDVHKVKGFALNTSNYYATSTCYEYG